MTQKPKELSGVSEGFIGAFIAYPPLVAQALFYVIHHGEIWMSFALAVPVYALLGGLHILYFFRAPAPRKLAEMSHLYIIWRNVSLIVFHGLAILQLLVYRLDWIIWIGIVGAAICVWTIFKIWARDITPSPSS